MDLTRVKGFQVNILRTQLKDPFFKEYFSFYAKVEQIILCCIRTCVVVLNERGGKDRLLLLNRNLHHFQLMAFKVRGGNDP